MLGARGNLRELFESKRADAPFSSFSGVRALTTRGTFLERSAEAEKLPFSS